MKCPSASEDTPNNQYKHLRLLSALNEAAAILLVAEEDTFAISLAKSMEIINVDIDVDRVYIWKNETINDELYYVNCYEWLRNKSPSGLLVHPTLKYRYNTEPGWKEDRFRRDECINGPLYSLSPGEREMLGPYGIKSILVVPVFLRGQLWGFVSYDDCHSERTFTEEEVDALRSASLMMVSIVNRIEQITQINEIHERTKLMLDSQPLCAVLFDRNAGVIDCNGEVAKLFRVKDKEEFKAKFLHNLSPEFQPDGQRSVEKAVMSIAKALEDGKFVFEWQHLTLDGAIKPCEVILVRVVYEGEYIVAGFMRDLSEEKRMMDEIEERDLLLHTVNRAADILLAATEETFEDSLQKGISLLAKVIEVDGVVIWRNETRNGSLHYALHYKWLTSSGANQSLNKKDLAFPYGETVRTLSKGEYVNVPLSGLPPVTWKFLEPYNVKSVLLIPLFLDNRFWGFISFFDCRSEKMFRHDEVDILHSAGLMIIDAIKRLEHSVEARQADERAKLMLNATPLGCSLWDEHENCIDCNEEVLRMYALRDKQEFMKRFYELSPEIQPDGQSSLEKGVKNFRKAFSEGRCTFDWMHYLPDGTPMPTEITLIRLKYGDKHVVASYVRDLREYKRLIKNEEEARLLMNKFTAILENVDAMIFVADLDYNIIFMNQNLEQTFGSKRDRCIGQKCYKVLRNFDEPCATCQLPGLLPDKESLPTDLEEYRWDETLKMWTESKVSIIRWVDDSLVHFHSLIDRSKEKEFEDELRKAMEASVAASASKTAFLANMSHEIRTPMNSIVGFAELAIDGDSSKKTKDYLGKIIESAKWLLHLINDILDISKIESGKMELENVPFDLYSIFMSCQSAILPSAKERGIDLFITTEPLSGKMLLGDPVRLYQALMNLLSNAVKFTSAGSVSLLSAVKNFTDDSAVIYFEVKDTGIGMTPEQIERIFDPFMQGDVSITRNFGGTGLGLAITRNITEMMGGRLAVESTAGVGSKFSFELPFNTVEARNGEPGNEYHKLVTKPTFDGLILLCEDNRMNQEVICEHLGRVGLKTLIAENGKIGVQMVQDRIQKGQEPFDLIFMDMHMPVMDGLAATLKIISMGIKTPIIAMTANVMTHDLQLYKKNGISDCIGKPFTTQELWHCLLKYLEPLGSIVEDEAEQALKNEKLLKKLQSNFVTFNHGKFDEITGAIGKKDIQLAHRLAHSLKSNAGMIGRIRLQRAAERVETLLKKGEIDGLEVLMSILETELKLVLEELNSLQNEPAAAGEPPDTGQVLVLFEQLQPMLENINPACADLLDDIRVIPGADELARQIEEYDFENALVTLAKLKKKWE